MYHRQCLRLLDAINFSFVYILQSEMTCGSSTGRFKERCEVGLSVFTVRLNLTSRLGTPVLTGKDVRDMKIFTQNFLKFQYIIIQAILGRQLMKKFAVINGKIFRVWLLTVKK